MTEFETALKEQLRKLAADCIAFETIDECVYTNISVTLRLLFYDNGSQKSLLTLLGLKDKLQMLDTSLKPGTISFWELGDNVSHQTITHTAVYGGLVAKQVVLEDGAPVYHYKPLATHPQYVQYQTECVRAGRFLPVKEWLEKEIYSDNKGVKLSRIDLIKEVANKDGGAHIDPDDKKSKVYKQLRRRDGLGIIVNGSTNAFLNNPVPSSLMQMAQEVLFSIPVFSSCK